MIGGGVEIIIRDISEIIGACDHISEFLRAHQEDRSINSGGAFGLGMRDPRKIFWGDSDPMAKRKSVAPECSIRFDCDEDRKL
jgi:hypothetical protein